MKTNIKIFAPMLLAIIIGSLTLIFAQSIKQTNERTPGGKGKGFGGPHSPIGGPGRGGLPPQILDKLNLTDAQKQQIQSLQEGAGSGSKENFEKIKTYDDQLKALVEGGTFDEDGARQILNNRAQTMIELELVRLRTDVAIKNILTADQKAQLEQLKQQRPDFTRGGRPSVPPAVQN